MRWSLVSHRREGRSTVMRLRTHPGRVARFFGAKPKEVEFIGDCTVWHELPTWKRCGTAREAMLSEFHAMITHKEGR
jgi:hypothetical protein